MNAGLQSLCPHVDKTTFTNDLIYDLTESSINDVYFLTDGVHLRRQTKSKLETKHNQS